MIDMTDGGGYELLFQTPFVVPQYPSECDPSTQRSVKAPHLLGIPIIPSSLLLFLLPHLWNSILFP